MGLLLAQHGCDERTSDPVALVFLQKLGLDRKDYLSIDHLQLDLPDGMGDGDVALLAHAIKHCGLRLNKLVLHNSVATASTMDALLAALWCACADLECVDLRGCSLSKAQAWWLGNMCLYHGIALQMDAPVGHLVSHPAIMPAYDGLQLWEQHGNGAGGDQAMSWVDRITGVELHGYAAGVDGFVDLIGSFKDRLPELDTFVCSGGSAWTTTHLDAVRALLSGGQRWQHLAFDGVALGAVFKCSHEREKDFVDGLQALGLQVLSMRHNGFEAEHVVVLACLITSTNLQLQGNARSFLDKLVQIAPQFNQEGGLQGRSLIDQPYNIKEDAMGSQDDKVFNAKLSHLSDIGSTGSHAEPYLDFRAYVSKKAKASLPADQPLLGMSAGLSEINCQRLMRWVANEALEHTQETKGAGLFRLFLSRADLSDAHLFEIGDVLRGDAPIDTLDVSDNHEMTMEGLWAIARGLQANTYVRRLALGGHDLFKHASSDDMDVFLLGIGSCDALYELDLSGSHFSRDNCKAMLKTVLNSKHISHLDLSKTTWSADGEWLNQADIKGLLAEVFEENPYAGLGALKTILLQQDGTKIIDVSHVFLEHLGVQLQQDEQSLAPLCDFMRYTFPVAPNEDMLLAVMKSKTKLDGGVTFSSALNVIGMGLRVLDAFRGPDGVLLHGQSAQAQTRHIENVIGSQNRADRGRHLEQFCQQALDSLGKFFGPQASGMRTLPMAASKKVPLGWHDDHVTGYLYGVQQDRLAASMAMVHEQLGLGAAGGGQSDVGSACASLEEWACYVLHLQVQQQKKRPTFLVPHLALGVCMAAVIAGAKPYLRPSLAARHTEDGASVALLQQQHQLIASQQQAHIQQLATAPVFDARQALIRKCLVVAAILLASAAVFTALYFAAPAVLASVSFLAALSQVAQAAACWGMVMGASMCIAGVVFGYRASQQKQPAQSYVPYQPDEGVDVSQDSLGRRGFFSPSFGLQTKDPRVSPRKPMRPA